MGLLCLYLIPTTQTAASDARQDANSSCCCPLQHQNQEHCNEPHERLSAHRMRAQLHICSREVLQQCQSAVEVVRSKALERCMLAGAELYPQALCRPCHATQAMLSWGSNIMGHNRQITNRSTNNCLCPAGMHDTHELPRPSTSSPGFLLLSITFTASVMSLKAMANLIWPPPGAAKQACLSVTYSVPGKITCTPETALHFEFYWTIFMAGAAEG